MSGGSVDDDVAVVEVDNAIAVGTNDGHAVGDEDECGAVGEEAVDTLFALGSEVGVAHGHNLIDQQDFGLDGGGDTEAEAREHARRVLVDRGVDEGTDPREVDDVIHERCHLSAGLALEDAVEDNVFTARELL